MAEIVYVRNMFDPDVSLDHAYNDYEESQKIGTGSVVTTDVVWENTNLEKAAVPVMLAALHWELCYAFVAADTHSGQLDTEGG